MEVYPGPDGQVRNVKVKTSTGVCSRPVTKVAGDLSCGRRVKRQYTSIILKRLRVG